MENPKCKKCSILLTDKNWQPSSKRRRYYICTSCKSATNIIQQNKIRASVSKLDDIYDRGGFCVDCYSLLTRDNWMKSSAVKQDHICKACHSGRAGVDKKNVKSQVMDAYGGKCQCCGETCISMLTIDHIDDSGSKHRATTNLIGDKIYRWLRRNNYPKDNYQVLCFNCNISKHALGMCGHSLSAGK